MDKGGPIQRWEQTYQKALFIPRTSTWGLLQIFEKEVQVGQTLPAGWWPLPAPHVLKEEDWESSLREYGRSLLCRRPSGSWRTAGLLPSHPEP